MSAADPAAMRPDAIIPHLNMTVLDALRLARANNMHLICDGYRTIIAPHIPPGWREIPVRIKQRPTGKDMPCAA